MRTGLKSFLAMVSLIVFGRLFAQEADFSPSFKSKADFIKSEHRYVDAIFGYDFLIPKIVEHREQFERSAEERLARLSEANSRLDTKAREFNQAVAGARSSGLNLATVDRIEQKSRQLELILAEIIALRAEHISVTNRANLILISEEELKNLPEHVKSKVKPSSPKNPSAGFELTLSEAIKIVEGDMAVIDDFLSKVAKMKAPLAADILSRFKTSESNLKEVKPFWKNQKSSATVQSILNNKWPGSHNAPYELALARVQEFEIAIGSIRNEIAATPINELSDAAREILSDLSFMEGQENCLIAPQKKSGAVSEEFQRQVNEIATEYINSNPGMRANIEDKLKSGAPNVAAASLFVWKAGTAYVRSIPPENRSADLEKALKEAEDQISRFENQINQIASAKIMYDELHRIYGKPEAFFDSRCK